MMDHLTAPVPRLHRRPAFLARRLHQLCQAVVAEALADAGLTHLEYPALSTLAEEPGLDQRRLALAIGVDRNSTGLLLDGLERRGLVRRDMARDRRARSLHLTEAGRTLRDRVRPLMLAANTRILAPLPPEDRELFVDMLLRLVEQHSDLARPGAGRRRPSREGVSP